MKCHVHLNFLPRGELTHRAKAFPVSRCFIMQYMSDFRVMLIRKRDSFSNVKTNICLQDMLVFFLT